MASVISTSTTHLAQTTTPATQTNSESVLGITADEQRRMQRLFPPTSASRTVQPAKPVESLASLIKGLDEPRAKRVIQLFGGTRGFHQTAIDLLGLAKRVAR